MCFLTGRIESRSHGGLIIDNNRFPVRFYTTQRKGKPGELAMVIKRKLTVDRGRWAIPHVEPEEFADLPTPTHINPRVTRFVRALSTETRIGRE